ncbi:hypothetical protein BpHYR1_021341 [Brachionus plicatilis]|uniref:Uncharacterized protein n=1 Tax=Brachionus plicatilis TaxID=10195 RepID=A0A3M7Q9G4_BRAPC|nr:hypothetical protein BpHYR1_021341 [Brachionus plicatilis]
MKESCRIYLNTSNWNSFDEFIKWIGSHKIVEIDQRVLTVESRRKKVLPAFERNSIGPLNHDLFSIPTTSTQSDTPITALVNS